MPLPGIMGRMRGGVVPLPTFGTAVVDADGVDRSIYNFTMSIGAAAAERALLIGVTGVRSGSFSSAVSVDGSPAAPVVSRIGSTGGAYFGAEIYIIGKPTGTSADFSINFGTTMRRCGLIVWPIYDLASFTPHDTGSALADATAVSDTLDVLRDGVIVGVAHRNDSTNTISWTGISDLVQQNYSDAGRLGGGGSAGLPAQTGRTIQAGASGSTETVMVCASFR